MLWLDGQNQKTHQLIDRLPRCDADLPRGHVINVVVVQLGPRRDRQRQSSLRLTERYRSLAKANNLNQTLPGNSRRLRRGGQGSVPHSLRSTICNRCPAVPPRANCLAAYLYKLIASYQHYASPWSRPTQLCTSSHSCRFTLPSP
jgi:hypothetical protein